MLRCILVLISVVYCSGDDAYEFVRHGVSREGLSSYAEFADQKPEAKPEIHENVKTYIVTKKVPMPYAVTVEKKVPYPVSMPVRRPYAVYVPKPYLVQVNKPMPYPVKVPVPHPYAIEKHIPIPVKVPIDNPYPVHISKPFPIFFEKKVPYPVEKRIPIQVKIPYDRPYPVHIPIEKPLAYPVEKPIAYKISIKPMFQQIHPQKVENPTTEDTQNLIQSNSLKISSFTPSPYEADTNFITQSKHKAISFLPGSQETYSQQVNSADVSAAIHVSGLNPVSVDNSSDWIPKKHFVPSKLTNFVPSSPYKYPTSDINYGSIENKDQYKYSISDVSGNTENKEQESYTLKYDPKDQQYKFHFESEDSKKYSTPLYEVKAPQFLQLKSPQHLAHSFPLEGMKDKHKGNYQFYNIHPHKDQTSSISFQKFESKEQDSSTENAMRIKYYRKVPQNEQTQYNVLQETLAPSYYQENTQKYEKITKKPEDYQVTYHVPEFTYYKTTEQESYQTTPDHQEEYYSVKSTPQGFAIPIPQTNSHTGASDESHHLGGPSTTSPTAQTVPTESTEQPAETTQKSRRSTEIYTDGIKKSRRRPQRRRHTERNTQDN